MKKIVYLVLSLTLSQITLSTQTSNRYTYTTQSMGTTWSLTFYCDDQIKANNLAKECWAMLDSLNMIFSDYDEKSELSMLSSTAGSGHWIKVSSPLWEVLTFSDALSRKSRGSFDVTIGPLSKIWRRAIRRQEFPDHNLLTTAKEKVGFQYINFDLKKQSVRLQKEGMRLDMGGIAKGYAIKALFSRLTESGVSSAIVDGGGDMMIGDIKPDGSTWSIKVEGLAQDIALSQVAIACSGSSYRSLAYQDQTYAHIIDPTTGLGVKNLSSLCVLADDPMIADALASTLSVLGDLEADILDDYGARLLFTNQSSLR